MVIGIIGADGIGKSTLADALGAWYAKRDIAIIIDSDLTRPTIPARELPEKDMLSLGDALDGRSISDIKPYLAQHPKIDGLFYAGLISGNNILSYQNGIESRAAAEHFIDICSAKGTVILDVSGQRVDPFLAAAIIKADKLIIAFTPDLAGYEWLLSIQPLFSEASIDTDKLVYVGMRARTVDYATVVEKSAGIRFAAVLKDLRGNGVAMQPKYTKAVNIIIKRIESGGADG